MPRMTDSPAKLHRIARIATLRQEATRLKAAARHASVQALLALAERDLAEGTELLRPDRRPEQEPWILAMVDTTIQLAEWRLNTVGWAVRTYGPDAMMIGE